MKRLTILTALLVIVVAAPPAYAAQTVTIASFSFTPASLTASLGDSITFNNTAAIGHTATSDGGFWDTGTIAGSGVGGGGGGYPTRSSTDVVFSASGTFAYHCAIHPSMTAVIVVPVTVAPAGPVIAGTELTITFASEPATGRTYEVQRRRGHRHWVTLASGTGATSVTYALGKEGRFRFRAAAIMNGWMSGWSPSVLAKVIAA
jgi:plastocyanin